MTILILQRRPWRHRICLKKKEGGLYLFNKLLNYGEMPPSTELKVAKSSLGIKPLTSQPHQRHAGGCGFSRLAILVEILSRILQGDLNWIFSTQGCNGFSSSQSYYFMLFPFFFCFLKKNINPVIASHSDVSTHRVRKLKNLDRCCVCLLHLSPANAH